MRKVNQLKLCITALFIVAGAGVLLTNNFTNQTVHAFSAGPPAGYTRAPGEEPDACRECHLPQEAGTGNITVNAPPTYAPGQTYQISVVHTNTDATRKRWGFQLTALDDTNQKAGTLAPRADGLTQVLNNQGPFPARQYIEHTSLGNFDGQTGGATWTFNWTAPSTDVGPVTFYAAGNHANGNGNSDGDHIYFTFTTIAPAAAAGDFSLNVSPATQTILPGASGAYTVTVTPSNNFTGTVNLSVTGLPAGASASFDPASVQITDATPRSSTLTIDNSSTTPLGNFTLTVDGTSGSVQHIASAFLVTGPTMFEAGLNVRILARNLNQPVALAAISASDLFVLEKASGKVLRVTQGAVQSTVLDLAVNSASERGLLGIALHPNFPANPRVYLYWTESSTGADTTDTDAVPLLGNRVDSFLWNGATLTLDKNLIKLRALQQDAGQPSRGNHNGGVIRFGPDGKLYVVMGDNGRRGLLQNLPFGPSVNAQGPLAVDDQFGGPEPDHAHLSGVILRLNDDGSVPADNPFFNAATNLTGEAAANVKKVFAYGIRNSFGMAFDPLSGQLWTQENGDDSFDEINRVVPAFNGGWIQLMGPSARVAEFKAIESGRSGGLQQIRWPPDRIADTPAEALARLYLLPGAIYTEPEFSWKYAVAPSAVGFIRSRALGANNEGTLIVGASRTTLLGGYLFRFKLASDRRKLSFTDTNISTDLVADNLDKFDINESQSLLFGKDFGITTDIQTAPDGSLYVVSLSDGAIYEISAKPGTLSFNTQDTTVTEGNTSLVITVTRGGDTNNTVSVDYRTIDDPAAVPCDPTRRKPDGTAYPQGAAYARCDYATATGTLTFAPGETSKIFGVSLIDDGHAEPTETFGVELLNPAGATLDARSTKTITITDNDAANAPNPIYETFTGNFFVRQQYLDFLSREPDAAGQESWLRVLRDCSDVQSNPQCDRITVSASFFRSQEFQLKGYFVYLFYQVSLGRLPRYTEIIPDMASVTGATAAEVFAKRDAFAGNWLARPEFKTLYPDTLTPAEYVDKLLLTAGATLTGAVTRETLIADLRTGRKTRAEVLRAIVEHPAVNAKEFNEAFVAMQYFGYLRRDPDAQGYQNWLNYLNANPTDFRTMVRGFLNSNEYLLRFGKI
jgi:glucose/arabinose dehydrogenase